MEQRKLVKRSEIQKIATRELHVLEREDGSVSTYYTVPNYAPHLVVSDTLDTDRLLKERDDARALCEQLAAALVAIVPPRKMIMPSDDLVSVTHKKFIWLVGADAIDAARAAGIVKE